MEKVKYEDLSESNSGKVKDVETINKTLHNLNSLFKTSGCDEQICEIIMGKLPDSVKGNALVSLNPCSSSPIFFGGGMKSFTYRKVASSRLSRLVAHFQNVYEGDFGPKLNSRAVYCSRIYGMQDFFLEE